MYRKKSHIQITTSDRDAPLIQSLVNNKSLSLINTLFFKKVFGGIEDPNMLPDVLLSQIITMINAIPDINQVQKAQIQLIQTPEIIENTPQKPTIITKKEAPDARVSSGPTGPRPAPKQQFQKAEIVSTGPQPNEFSSVENLTSEFSQKENLTEPEPATEDALLSLFGAGFGRA